MMDYRTPEEDDIQPDTENIKKHEIEELQRHKPLEPNHADIPYPPAVPTDSGYASMGRAAEPAEEDEQDDIQTVFTDNQELNVPNDAKEKLAMAFAAELTRDLQATLAGKVDQIGIENSLGSILKEFSIRCRGSARAGEQREATTFVRHYRRRVFHNFLSDLFILSDAARNN